MTQTLETYYVLPGKSILETAKNFREKLLALSASELEKPDTVSGIVWKKFSLEAKKEVIAWEMAEVAALQAACDLMALYKDEGATVVKDNRNGSDATVLAPSLLIRCSPHVRQDISGLPGIAIFRADVH